MIKQDAIETIKQIKNIDDATELVIQLADTIPGGTIEAKAWFILQVADYLRSLDDSFQLLQNFVHYQGRAF